MCSYNNCYGSGEPLLRLLWFIVIHNSPGSKRKGYGDKKNYIKVDTLCVLFTWTYMISKNTVQHNDEMIK